MLAILLPATPPPANDTVPPADEEMLSDLDDLSDFTAPADAENASGSGDAKPVADPEESEDAADDAVGAAPGGGPDALADDGTMDAMDAATATTSTAAAAAETFAAFTVPAASVAAVPASAGKDAAQRPRGDAASSSVSSTVSGRISQSALSVLQAANSDASADGGDAGTLTDDLAGLAKDLSASLDRSATQGSDRLSQQSPQSSGGGDGAKSDFSALMGNAGSGTNAAALAGSAPGSAGSATAGFSFAGTMMSPSGTLVSANLQMSQMSSQAATAQASALDELGLTIATRSLQGVRQFQIQIDPPELGRVEVKLSITSAGTTHAALIVDKPQTLQMLQQDAHNLARTLQEAGVDLAGGGLSFSLRGDGSDQDRSNDANTDDRTSLNVSATAENDETLSANPILSLAPESVRLDIRV